MLSSKRSTLEAMREQLIHSRATGFLLSQEGPGAFTGQSDEEEERRLNREVEERKSDVLQRIKSGVPEKQCRL